MPLLQCRAFARRRAPLTVTQVLAWADDFHTHTGRWPKIDCGPVRADLNETWHNIHQALRLGLRGLPGGDTLSRLLARRLGARNRSSAPRLTAADVIAWAEAHRRRTGRWPSAESGTEALPPARAGAASTTACAWGIGACPAGPRWRACWRSGWSPGRFHRVRTFRLLKGRITRFTVERGPAPFLASRFLIHPFPVPQKEFESWSVVVPRSR